jgi:hypothetical protein
MHELEQEGSDLGRHVEEGKEGSGSATRGQHPASNDPAAAGVGGWHPGALHGFKTGEGSH